MSYSFFNDCQDCTKKDQCTDRAFVNGAIEGIHQTDVNHSHLGSGTIELKCQNFDAQNLTSG